MPGCVVPNCSNNAAKGFRLFRLPIGDRNIERRTLWLELIRRPDIPLNGKICEGHFLDDQFENLRDDGKKKLRPNAIPDLLKENIYVNQDVDPLSNNERKLIFSVDGKIVINVICYIQTVNL